MEAQIKRFRAQRLACCGALGAEVCGLTLDTLDAKYCALVNRAIRTAPSAEVERLFAVWRRTGKRTPETDVIGMWNQLVELGRPRWTAVGSRCFICGFDPYPTVMTH
jgi:hypothetical protein